MIVGPIACSVEVHVGGDSIHAGLGAESEERKNIGTTGTEVGSRFKQGAAQGQVEVQRYVGAQGAGGTRGFVTEFPKPCFGSLFLEPLMIGAFAAFRQGL